MTNTSKKEITEAATPAQAPKFTIARLRKDCIDLFGVTTSTFDGATYGLDGEYTVEKMRGHIKSWQGVRAVSVKKKEGK